MFGLLELLKSYVFDAEGFEGCALVSVSTSLYDLSSLKEVVLEQILILHNWLGKLHSFILSCAQSGGLSQESPKNSVSTEDDR